MARRKHKGRESWSVLWDLPEDPEGNTAHVAEHGLTIDEIEDVLLNASLPIDKSDSSGRDLRQGWTSTGRWIVVTWEEIDDDTVRPVTAYEPEPE
jgi:uncharacterized DUF497 family protein